MIIKVENLKSILEEEFFKKYKNIALPYTNHLIACAGEEHCKYGVMPNKPDAIDLANYLEKKVPLDSDAKIRMYWSACVKGCGLHDLGNIGFEGCKVKVDGKSEYGVHIFLEGRVNGSSTNLSKIGYKVLKSIPLKFAKYYVEPLILEYKRVRVKNESFDIFNKRVLEQYSKAAVGFIIMLKTYTRVNKLNIDMGFREGVKRAKTRVLKSSR